MTDPEKIKALADMIRELCCVYLQWDVSCQRRYTKSRIYALERDTGLQFIPPPSAVPPVFVSPVPLFLVPDSEIHNAAVKEPA